MVVKITAKGQITFPKRVLEAMGVGPGDRLELLEGPDGGYTLKPRREDPAAPAPKPKRIDYSKLGTLRDKIDPNVEPLDIRKFRDQREQGHGPATRY